MVYIMHRHNIYREEMGDLSYTKHKRSRGLAFRKKTIIFLIDMVICLKGEGLTMNDDKKPLNLSDKYNYLHHRGITRSPSLTDLTDNQFFNNVLFFHQLLWTYPTSHM